MLALLVGLMSGLGGETLLFFQRQCRLVEDTLREDFRVLLYLKSDLEPGKQKVLEEKLRALPDVDDVRAVSGQEQLAALKREDPELVDAVTLIGDNPLTPAFEVRLGEGGIAHVAQWIAQAGALADFADVRYKPAQVQAILQSQFYARFIDLALAALVCLLAALALAGLWSAGKTAAKSAALPVVLASGGGALLGVGAVCLMAVPMRAVSPWWGWPSAGAQLALLAGSCAAGWVLCARHD